MNETLVRHLLAMAGALAVALAAASQASAQERFELGGRLDVVGADGEPSNDILGAGLFGRWRLGERWWLGVGVDHSPEFDVERPNELLGLTGDPEAGEIDASATSTALTAWIERRHGDPDRRLGWSWSVGGGFADVSVDDVAGPLAGGGTYAITQEVGTELLLGAGVGLRVRLGGSWAFEGTLRADQHFTDWTVVDRTSGRTTDLDDYLVRGVTLGVTVGF